MMPFGLKIAIIHRTIHKRLDEKASSLGLSSVQLRVLGSISRLEACGKTEIHQNDLERIEHVTHPAMTKLLQRLESKGFIQCIQSENDRRYKTIRCTEQSTEIYKMILEQDEEVFNELCKNLSINEKNDFLSLIDQIIKDIDN